MRLTKWDRDVIALWADLGHVPECHTERETALGILQKALHDVDEMHDIVRQLKDFQPAPQHESLF